MLGFYRRWRRRRLAETPVPPEWFGYLDRRVPFFDALGGDERTQFLRDLRIFVWEKHWFGAGGMEITDEVRVVIAAAAVRLTLQIGIGHYDDLTEIIVYPSHYRHPDSDAIVFGEAHQWGTVVLSWKAVTDGLANPDDGLDTATHEFAHVLDRKDGAFDGTPVLHAHEHYGPWAEILSHHYFRLRDQQRPERKALRAYGATNEAEFFAVATEVYFERPDLLQRKTPELYETLRRFYAPHD